MDIRALRYVIAVCDAGSVSAAARELHLSQPALSRSIASFERRLGLRLFDSSSGPLTPTAAGSRMLPIARDIVARADLGQRLLEALAEGRDARFRVVCPEATLRHVVAPFLAETSAPIEDAAGLPLSSVYAELGGRRADLALNTFSPPPILSTRVIGHSRVRVHLPAGHPLATATGPIAIEDLIPYDQVLMGRGSAVRDACDRAFAELGAHPRVAAEPDSSDMAQALTASGSGLSLVLDPPRHGLLVRPLIGVSGPVTITIHAAWDPDHYLADRLSTLADELAAWFTRTAGPGSPPADVRGSNAGIDPAASTGRPGQSSPASDKDFS